MSKIKQYLSFDFSNLRGDILGGITAGIVAMPLALAFGVQSGLGAVTGLYGSIFIGFFASLFGGTSTQVSGPTAPMTAVSMVVIAGILALYEGDINTALPHILLVFFTAGMLQVLFGVLKIGTYIHFIPYSVVSGFMTGIGCIILISQVLPLMGYYPKEDSEYVHTYSMKAKEVILEQILQEEAHEQPLTVDVVKETVKRAENISEEQILKEEQILAAKEATGVKGTFHLINRAIKHINYQGLLLSLLTIAIIYGFKRITVVIPSTLVALLIVSCLAYLFLPSYKTIGDIPSGFPSFNLSVLSKIRSFKSEYVLSAISLALLGSIDSLLTSVVADNLTGTKTKPNKELIGQGIGNSISALFGGLPGAGATIRTVVNIKSGGKTRISGMVAGIVLLMILLVFSGLASKIPSAVLSGILVTVGFGVIDYKGLKHIKQSPKSEVVIMFLVIGLTVFVGLIEAVVIGLVLSSVIFMKHISDLVDHRTEVTQLKDFSKETHWEEQGNFIEQYGHQIYIKHLDGPIFFGFASRFQEILKSLPEIEVVIIRMDKVPYVDQSGLYAMENTIINLQNRNIKVVFTDLHGQPLEMLHRFNLIPGLVKQKYNFDSFKSCAVWLEGYLSVR